MLNRLVDNYYWLGRYTERALNTCKLLRTYFPLLTSVDERALHAERVMSSMLFDPYTDFLASLNDRMVFERLILDSTQPESLISVIQSARSNLFAVRYTVPTEVWDVLNGLYIKMNETTGQDLVESTPDGFLKDMTTKLYAMDGIMHRVMLHENDWRMFEIGRILERIEYMLSLFRVTFALSEQSINEELRSLALLESMNGVETYRRLCQSQMVWNDLASYVFVCERSPQSMIYSVGKLEIHLRKLLVEQFETTLSQHRIFRISEQMRAGLSMVDFNSMSIVEMLHWIDQQKIVSLHLHRSMLGSWPTLEGVGA